MEGEGARRTGRGGGERGREEEGGTLYWREENKEDERRNLPSVKGEAEKESKNE